MEKMKILVIGASGLLAGPVIRKLDEKGMICDCSRGR
jgi:nucleoside-diphosphate-sugar epimerase